MNDDNRYQRDDVLLDAYLNALWLDLNAEIPYGLDQEVAASARALVESEVDLFGAQTPSQQTRIQIWNNALAVAQKSQGKRKGKQNMNYPYVAKRGEKSPPKFLAFGAILIVAIFGVFLFSNRFNQPTPQYNPPQYGALQQFDQFALTATSIVAQATQTANLNPLILTATQVVREATQIASSPLEQTANAVLADAHATVDALHQTEILPLSVDADILTSANELVVSLFNYNAHIQSIQQAVIEGGTEAMGGRFIDITLTNGSALLTRKIGDELILYAFQLPTGLVTYINGSEGESIYRQRQGLSTEILFTNGELIPNLIPTIAPPHNFLPTIPPFEMLATPTPFPNQFPATATPFPGAGS